MTATVNIAETMNKLDEFRQSVIIQLMADMLKAQQEEENFDYLSQETIAELKRADEERERGEYIEFKSPEEMLTHFDLPLSLMEN
jgi:hypothetical protein